MQAGLAGTEQEAASMLDDEGLGKRVDEENIMARARGVVAVPSYLVQGRWFVGGMQRSDVFLDLFVRATGQEGSKVLMLHV